MKNMTIEKRKLLEEPVVIEFEDEEEDEEDLSWMIQNNDQEETKTKKLKGKK
jgi:hypothetical protein